MKTSSLYSTINHSSKKPLTGQLNASSTGGPIPVVELWISMEKHHSYIGWSFLWSKLVSDLPELWILWIR